MAKLFSFDSKPAQFLSRIWDLFLLNFLFVFCSLPIVTLGVSAVAAYTVALKIVEDREGGIVRDYFCAFKANLRQGLILSVAFILAVAAVAIDFYLFETVENNPIGFLIVGIISAVLVFVHFFYVFALSARYKSTLFRHLTNSRNIFFRFYGRSLLCSLLVAFEVWLFFFSGWLLLYIGVFIAPILIITTISSFAIKFFRTIESENKAKSGQASARKPEEITAGEENDEANANLNGSEV